MTIEKLTPATPDITAQNVARIAELFPECVTEGPWGTASDAGGPVLDFELLRQALSNHLVEGPQERYRLDWPGKREALLVANTAIDKTLRAMRDDSVDFDATRNLFIEGDNLDALKLLQETYLGKVKMIYIDPPYNTGKDFIYKDNFAEARESYEASSGQRDEEGGRLSANPETNGRFHSDWLSMMYPRLKLARSLLHEHGVIFVSLDDHEVDAVRKICDELFGEANFVANIIWQKVHTRKNSSRYFSTSHEYVLLYARNKELWPRPLFPRENTNAYSNANNHPKGPWKPDPITAHNPYSAEYTITKPNGITLKRPQGGYWRFSKETIDQKIADGEIVWGEGESYPMIMRFLSEVQDGMVPITIFDRVFAGDTAFAKREVDALMKMQGLFEYPKPTKLIRRLLQISSTADDIVMDFFAGSGSTADAVMQQNAADGQRRRMITVQIDDEISHDVSKEADAAAFCKSNALAPVISSITRERIRRAGVAVLKDNPALAGTLDTGFRAFRIDSSNLHDTRLTPAETTQAALSGMISHIKDDRSDEDLLFGALLRWGVDITLPIAKRELLGRTVWFVDPPAEGETGAALIACFAKAFDGKGGIDTQLADALGALAPLRVLFRDDGFASDAVKENVASRLKQRAPDTAVRVL